MINFFKTKWLRILLLELLEKSDQTMTDIARNLRLVNQCAYLIEARNSLKEHGLIKTRREGKKILMQLTEEGEKIAIRLKGLDAYEGKKGKSND